MNDVWAVLRASLQINFVVVFIRSLGEVTRRNYFHGKSLLCLLVLNENYLAVRSRADLRNLLILVKLARETLPGEKESKNVLLCALMSEVHNLRSFSCKIDL